MLREDKSLLKKNIVDYFEFKNDTEVNNCSVIHNRPISFGDRSLARNQLAMYMYCVYSDKPSEIHVFCANKYESDWFSEKKIIVSEDIDADVGNVVFSESNYRLYSLVDLKFLVSSSTNWSKDSRSLLYPPCKLNSFDMCGVENDNSIYLYNAEYSFKADSEQYDCIKFQSLSV